MLKIGDFSRLSQVSVKTLRYYDEVGLLKPTQVDQVSGYRYYSVAQLRQLPGLSDLVYLGYWITPRSCPINCLTWPAAKEYASSGKRYPKARATSCPNRS